jgi:putative transposase
VEPGNPEISITRQCELLGLGRSAIYYQARPESIEDLEIMRLLDEQYTERPTYGYRRMTNYLQGLGWVINR